MMLTLWYNKFVPAAVLSALAGTNHMIEDNRPMAETIMPRMVHFRTQKSDRKRAGYKHTYECIDCNAHFIARSYDVALGQSRCNPCMAIARGNRIARHGYGRKVGRSHLYTTYHKMKDRCYNPSQNGFKHYGGRGIAVCDEWQTFEGFMKWDKFGEWSPGQELDRIDNNGNYEPSNCRWISHQANSQNRRNSVLDQEAVMLIRIFSGSGVPNKTLDRWFGLYAGCTARVIKFKIWGNV